METTRSASKLFYTEHTINIRTFFTELTYVMMENEKFFQLISKATIHARFLIECKDMLKKIIYDARFDKANLPRSTFDVYSEYISCGIVGIYTNWLSGDREMSLDDLISLTTEAVKIGWDNIMIS